VPVLQKVVALETDEKTYHKYQVVLPADQVDELGWEQGDDLTAEIDGDALVLHPDTG
jgi:bifunctional DNA-binding transcriptional regulator/antitoxin component of YhaV-PrlF toxin-antitoxin module